MSTQPYQSYSDYVQAPSQYQYPPGYIPPEYAAYYGIPPQQPLPPSEPPAPPQTIHIQRVNASVASQCMRRLIASELRNAGFKSYNPPALDRLEKEVVSFVEVLFRHAKEYATLANRVVPMAYDVVEACEDRNIAVTDLRRASKKKKRKRAAITPTRMVSPPPREPSPDILPSDDEDAPIAPSQPAVLPQTLHDLPDHLPSLPPKHTYLHTAPAVVKRAKLPSLDKRLDNASKVQQALRNLVKATEDTSGRGDVELSSGVVNWMATHHATRKRWKIR